MPVLKIDNLLMAFMLISAASALLGRDLIDAGNAHDFSGEITRSGTASVAVVPAPGLAADVYCLRLRFRLHTHNQGDWVDVASSPRPGLDFSDAQQAQLWVRAERAVDFLYLKLVDPQNPGANHSAFEKEIRHEGKALPAGEWVHLDIPLPEDPARRDGLTYAGFYVSASDERVPLNEDIVVHVGQFPYEVPPRPPWPPAPRGAAAEESGNLHSVWSASLAADGPWILVAGSDNQTDHTAVFKDGGVEFHADASGWNEFLWSDPAGMEIKPSTTYRLQFDYQVLAPPGGDVGATFYALVRAQGTIREDVGWQRWQGNAGTRGRRRITFTTNDMPGYYLNFGIRHHGAIRLYNLRLWEIPDGDGE